MTKMPLLPKPIQIRCYVFSSVRPAADGSPCLIHLPPCVVLLVLLLSPRSGSVVELLLLLCVCRMWCVEGAVDSPSPRTVVSVHGELGEGAPDRRQARTTAFFSVYAAVGQQQPGAQVLEHARTQHTHRSRTHAQVPEHERTQCTYSTNTHKARPGTHTPSTHRARPGAREWTHTEHSRPGTNQLAVRLEAPPSVRLERDMLFKDAVQWSPLSTADRELDGDEAWLPA